MRWLTQMALSYLLVLVVMAVMTTAIATGLGQDWRDPFFLRVMGGMVAVICLLLTPAVHDLLFRRRAL